MGCGHARGHQPRGSSYRWHVRRQGRQAQHRAARSGSALVMVLMPGICVRDFRLMSLMRVTVVMGRAVVDIRGSRFVVNVPNARLFVETRSRSGAERKGCARREHAKQIKQRDQAPCPFPFRFGQFQEHSARAFDATTVPGKPGSAKCLVLCNRRWPSVLPPNRHPASILSPRSLVFTAAFIVTATVAVVQRDRSVSYAGSPCKLWMRTSVSPLPPSLMREPPAIQICHSSEQEKCPPDRRRTSAKPEV
jgi:hypothetical protein